MPRMFHWMLLAIILAGLTAFGCQSMDSGDHGSGSDGHAGHTH